MKTIIQASRPPFLLLPVVCILMATALSSYLGSGVDGTELTLMIIGGVAANMSVNLLNEYDDFKSGLDFTTHKTPFSGGSGALPSDPDSANHVLLAGCITLALTCLIGLYFCVKVSWSLLPLGVLGVVIILTYTPVLNKKPLLCLIAPGLCFGILMVIGAGLVQTGNYTGGHVLASLVPFFLVNNLLLLNQFPDREADRANGRAHAPIVMGLEWSLKAYGASAALAYLCIIFGAISGAFPTGSLFALLTLPLALFAWQKAGEFGDKLGQCPQAMAANVVTALATPVLLAISFWIA